MRYKNSLYLIGIMDKKGFEYYLAGGGDDYEKDREIMIAQGNINEVFYFLPGNKDVPVAKENIKKELEHVFTCLEKAQKRKSDEPLPWLDGAGVKISYEYEGQAISL